MHLSVLVQAVTFSAFRVFPGSWMRTLWSTALKPHREPGWAFMFMVVSSPGTAEDGENSKSTWHMQKIHTARSEVRISDHWLIFNQAFNLLWLLSCQPCDWSISRWRSQHCGRPRSHWGGRHKPQSGHPAPYLETLWTWETPRPHSLKQQAHCQQFLLLPSRVSLTHCSVLTWFIFHFKLLNSLHDDDSSGQDLKCERKRQEECNKSIKSFSFPEVAS